MPDAKHAEMDEVEHAAINRYRPVPAGVLAYAVVAGDGTRKLFTGTKDECHVVARKLTEAFLDGAHVAISARTPHVAETPKQEHDAGGVSLVVTGAPQPAAQQGEVALPEYLVLAVDRWFSENTGIGGCSDKDVKEHHNG